MRKVYFRTTHSAATEPAEVTHCIDCDEFLDDCTCDEPRCEACNEIATKKVPDNDEDLWLCDKCQADRPCVACGVEGDSEDVNGEPRCTDCAEDLWNDPLDVLEDAK